MEVIKPYIGKYQESSIFLNNGKYGYYLNYDKKLYGVPKCFEKADFKLEDAIKIIEYKKKKALEKDDNDIIKKLDTVESKKNSV
jgi:topoisomerase IA-like protein